ncbi:MAG: FAD-dependent oxidoreductase [Hyphomonadaceae bacterium]|nr:FAD-dependent oxidoreductase [Hyphomonadaceae bacterium]
MRELKADLCIIGAGAAGLSVAAGAAQLGLSVVLFEAGEMGGDCLNYGCVPSKALIAAADLVDRARNGGPLGLDTTGVSVDWPRVQAHVKRAIAAIAPHDSQERFEKLGCTVIRERARFEDERIVVSDSARVRAKRIVIATGSRAVLPPVPGLDGVGALTNESIFEIEALPSKLIILGGGAIGIELGQAFRRLGSEVVIVEAARALGAADAEARALVLQRLRTEGVEVLEGWRASKADRNAGGIALSIEDGAGAQRVIEGSHLLVAAGRAPVLAELNLEAAKVRYGKAGVETSPTLRSVSNPRVWALGDAAGRGLFTHLAGWHASVFVRNVLFKARTAADAMTIPSVVFSDPELAQIGLTESQARAQHGDAVQVSRWSFHDNDRAQAGGDTEGFCKLVLGKGGALLGATIVGAGAGELLAPVALAMAQKRGVRALTEPVLPYPTRGEIVKRAAGAYFTPTLFSPGTRFLVKMLQQIP